MSSLHEAEHEQTSALPEHRDQHSTPCYNVLKIAPTPFFADYGCHVRIYEETLALQKRGNRITICTYHSGDDVGNLNICRAPVTPWRKPVQIGSSMQKLQKLYYDGLLSAKCAEMAVRIKPDIIHAHMHEGALIGFPFSKLCRAPLVFDFQGSLTSEMLDHHFIERDSFFFRPLQRLEKTINRMADAVITSSQNAADVLIESFGYPPNKVHTVTDSVNTDVFLPRWLYRDQSAIEAAKADLGIPSHRKVVVYLGLLAEYQGTFKLLDAARELISRGLDVHFLIMGYPGEEHYRAAAMAMGIGNHVTFTGRVAYARAPLYLALGDVAVSPKMSETEGNGKLLNYMGCALPTVSFDTPVAHEILGPYGVYAKIGDSLDLADQLAGLLADQNLRLALGMALRERAAEEFSWDKAGEKILQVYAKVAR